MISQNSSFRTPERFRIKAHLFIKGYSLKNRCNDEPDLLWFPHRAGLETLYATLLISTIEQLFSSINALLKDASNPS